MDAALRQDGPVRVLPAAIQNTSAIFGSTADIRNAARTYKTRAVLSGTHRVVGNGIQVAFRLTDSEGNFLFGRIKTMPAGISEVGQDEMKEIQALLAQKNWDKMIVAREDPAFRNEKSRDFLLAGRELTQRQSADDLARAINCFQKAIDAEPNSVLARTDFARAVTTRTHYQHDAALLVRATKAAREAATLDPLSGEAHRAMASVLFHTGRPIDSLDEILTFIELSGPDVPAIALTGSLWRILGHPDKALAWFTIMAQWQRRPAEDIWIIGDCWSDLGDDAKAEAIYRRASELNPQLPDGWVGLCHLKLLNGDFEGARALCSENKNRHPESVYPRQMAAQVEFFSRNFPEAERLYEELLATDPGGGAHFYGATSYQSVLGRLRLRARNREAGNTLLTAAAQKEIAALSLAFDHPEILYRLAAIDASQGKIDDAVGHLIAARNAGWLDYRSMRLDPRFDAIRSDPRFQQVSIGMEEAVKQLRR